MSRTKGNPATATDPEEDPYRPAPSDAWRFFALALAISWLLWAPPMILGEFRGVQLFGLAGSFGPLLAAAVLTHRRHGNLRPLWKPLLHWRVRTHWYLVALMGPVAVVLIGAAAVDLTSVGAGAQPWGWAALPAALALSIVLGGGQEEPGWRGFAQPALQGRFTALSSSLIVGLLWALWHLPLFAMPGATQSQTGLHFGVYLLYAPGFAVLLAWIYNGTGGSVLLCVLTHGAANAATVALYPVAGLASQLILAAALWASALTVIIIFGPRTLGGPPTPGASDPVATAHRRLK